MWVKTMDSFIIIDGLVLWVFAILLIFGLICFIAMGCSYTTTLRENDRLKRRLRMKNNECAEINRELIKTKAAYYKLTDKPLEVE